MHRSILVIVFLLIFSFSTNAQQISETDQMIMTCIFNAQWQKADSLIDINIKLDPENPRYYYLKLPLHYYTRIYNNAGLNGDSLFQLVHDYALKTIEKAEVAEPSAMSDFYIGSAYDYLSRYNIRYSGRWDAYLSARRAVSHLEDAIEQDPSLIDAYMSLSVIEYFTAVRTSGFVRALIWIGGLLGDRETAINYMRNVAENGSLCKLEARFALAAVYRYFENDLDAAHQILVTLIDELPQNTFLQNVYHQTQLVQTINNEGTSVLTQISPDSVAVRYQITNPNVLNQLGYILVGENRYAEAVDVFLINIELYKDMANPYDSLAECYQLMGEYQKSIDYSRIALQKLETDQTISEQFRENLREILTQRLDDLSEEINI